MCSPVKAGALIGGGLTAGNPILMPLTAGLGAGVGWLEQQRTNANRAARDQQAAINAVLSQVKPSAPSLSLPPMTEPLKAASDSAATASQNTMRQQMLRAGLMSTFTRYSQSGAASSTPSPAGKATKLGG